MQTYIVKFAFDPEWPKDRIRPHIRTYTCAAESDSVEQVLGEWLGGEFGIKTLKISSKDADGNTTLLKEIHNPRRSTIQCRLTGRSINPKESKYE